MTLITDAEAAEQSPTEEPEAVAASAFEQITYVAIAGALISAFFAAMGVSATVLLMILGIIAVTAVVLGFIENGQKARK